MFWVCVYVVCCDLKQRSIAAIKDSTSKAAAVPRVDVAAADAGAAAVAPAIYNNRKLHVALDANSHRKSDDAASWCPRSLAHRDRDSDTRAGRTARRRTSYSGIVHELHTHWGTHTHTHAYTYSHR